MSKEISSKEWEMLSGYLDEQLTGKERIAFEAHLQSDPELQKELEGLRHVRLLLHQLPSKRAPRNFFVTPEMLPKPRAVHIFPIFRLASALAVVFLVVVFVGDYLFGSTTPSTVAGLAPLAMQSQSRNANSSSNQNSPIIQWGTPTPGGLSFGAQYGLGGGYGGGPGSSTSSQPNTVTADTPVPGETEIITPPPADTEILPPPPIGTPALAGTEELPTESPSVTTESSTVEPPPLLANPSSLSQAEGTTQDQYQSGPILGVNPTEGAKEASALTTPPSQPLEIPRPTLHVIEGILGLIAVMAALGAFFFYHREHL